MSCSRDTNGDGNCGQPACPECGVPEARKQPVYFTLQGKKFLADGILRCVQINERDVHVKYADPVQGSITIHNTSVEKVTAAIDAVKSKRR